MERWSLDPNADTFRALVAAYDEGHRHYHTAEHVQECLDALDGVAGEAGLEHEVELALWFHDAVYETTSSKNERRSADWAVRFLSEAGAGKAAVERVFAQILATMHGEEPDDPDSRLVVDIDLSILGREPERYERFEQDVRKEYGWVPALLYRRKRRQILESFLERDHIYLTAEFRSRYEDRARHNLAEAVESLVTR